MWRPNSKAHGHWSGTRPGGNHETLANPCGLLVLFRHHHPSRRNEAPPPPSHQTFFGAKDGYGLAPQPGCDYVKREAVLWSVVKRSKANNDFAPLRVWKQKIHYVSSEIVRNWVFVRTVKRFDNAVWSRHVWLEKKHMQLFRIFHGTMLKTVSKCFHANRV